jgi:hypothetical protein
VVWTLCVLGLAGVFVSGFFVDTLNLRWLLIPVALVAFPISALLSLVIVGVFAYANVFTKGMNQADRPSFLSALPSMIFLTAMTFFVWR